MSVILELQEENLYLSKGSVVVVSFGETLELPSFVFVLVRH